MPEVNILYSTEMDPYNQPTGWSCVLTWPQGGGTWRVGITYVEALYFFRLPFTLCTLRPTHAASKNHIVKLVVPIVVSVAAALGLLGVKGYA